MPITRERIGDDVVYTVTGPLDAQTVHRFFDLNYEDYQQLGDAIGIVIDLRQLTRLTVSGLSAAQSRMKGVVYDTPVAFLGEPDSLLMTFLSGLEALSSRARRRFHFFRGDEATVDDAVAWLDAWFESHPQERDELRGRITARPSPPRGQSEKAE